MKKRKIKLTLLLFLVLISCTASKPNSDSDSKTRDDELKTRKLSWSDIYYKKAKQAKGWKYIVIHHSAGNNGNAKIFHDWHTEKGYGGLSYHFVIGNGNGSNDGEIETGFRWEEQISGTHVTVDSWYHNIFGIGICLVGDFNKTKPTSEQLSSLIALITNLSKEYKIPVENIIGHNDVPFGEIDWSNGRINVALSTKTQTTRCPGKSLNVTELRKSFSKKLVKG
jgi:N-acetyl-anhydromuramyl-L-alanine amidase AmpD